MEKNKGISWQDWRGEWALVTGASAGIGREFAVQLAAKGMNLVLVARRQALLDVLAEELRSAYGMQVLALSADLAQSGSAAELHSQLVAQGIRITLLVNNAGIGTWGSFDPSQLECYLDVLSLNCAAPLRLICEFTGDLADGGVVINVSSQAAFQPVPFMAVYGASKAFLHNLSLALFEEWRGRGIHVQTLMPGPTRTEFDQKAGAYESAIKDRAQPLEVVSASLEGLERGAAFVTNAKGIFQQRLFAGLAPMTFLVKMVGNMFRPKEAQ